MRARRFLLAGVVLLLVVGLVAGVLTGALSSLARQGLYATGLRSDGGASTLPPGTYHHPAVPSTPSTPEPEPANAPSPVLAPASPAAAPKAARVAERLRSIDRSGVRGTVTAAVLDVGTGKVLYADHGHRALMPASTTKLLTVAAALSILGPQHRFSTRVVRSGGTITLVGGGDPYLTRSRAFSPGGATLATLATRTAAALKKARRVRVGLAYDTSLFSGPAWHPDWPAMYADQVTPVSSLWVGEGRVGETRTRVPNAPRSAAQAFAAELRSRGIHVTRVASGHAPRGVAGVAQVASLPLDVIVEHLLMVSDNDAAEVVARQAALGAGRSGSFSAATRVVAAELAKLKVWDKGTVLRDGSGLSRRTRISADVEAKLMRATLSPDHPRLRAVATGLPVAGVEGSLRRRYGLDRDRPGRGLVRGKTGTLTGANARAGYVRGADGSMLVYALVVNNPRSALAAFTWFDRVTTSLARCGCH